MSKKPSLYNETKATQVAAFLLKLNGGKMNYLKCIKLLYAVEREAIKRWLHPVIYDELYSLPHGQVVGQTLDRAEYRSRSPNTFWSSHIKTTKEPTTNENTIHLVKECGAGKLSRAEIELIEEVFQNNKNKTPEQLMDEHHNPKLFPEWKNPGKSRIATDYSFLLSCLGKNQEQIEEFQSNMDELVALEALAC